MMDLLFSTKQNTFSHNLDLVPRSCVIFNPRDEIVIDSDNGISICFDEGNIDDWCVYICFGNVPVKWNFTGIPTGRPLDAWLFERFRYVCSSGYDSCILAKQLRTIFEQHLCDEDTVQDEVVAMCKIYADSYGQYSSDMYICFLIFYYFLIAEDHKAAREVGCCVPMIAIYKILKDSSCDIDRICNSLRGMKADLIKKDCHAVGIFHNPSPKLKDKKIEWNW